LIRLGTVEPWLEYYRLNPFISNVIRPENFAEYQAVTTSANGEGVKRQVFSNSVTHGYPPIVDYGLWLTAAGAA